MYQNDTAVKNFITRYLKENYEFVNQEYMDRKEFSDTFIQDMKNIYNKTKKSAEEFVFLEKIKDSSAYFGHKRGGWATEGKLVFELMKEVKGNITGPTGKYKLQKKKKR